MRILRGPGLRVAQLATIAVTFGCIASAAHAETLHDALRAAYRSNPQLAAERARLRATDEDVARAWSGYRPSISTSADVTLKDVRRRPRLNPSTRSASRGYSVSVGQALYRGQRTLGQVREAEANVLAGRETLRQTEQTILLEAVTAYMGVIRDMAVVRLNQANVRVLSKQLRANKLRFEKGTITGTDVHQSRSRKAGAEGDLASARSTLDASRSEYRRVVGQRPRRLVSPGLSVARVPRTLKAAIAAADRESPDVLAARFRAEAARHAIVRIRAELRPEVTLDGSVAHRFSPDVGVRESFDASVTARVNTPLYQGGEVHARVRQAKQTHVARLEEVQQARDRARANVRTAWSNWRAAISQMRAVQTQVVAAEKALKGVKAEETVGQRTVLDVLDAEQELLNARVSLVTRRTEVVTNAYSVLSAIGRLSVSELHLVREPYVPEVHYDSVRRRWWGMSITYKDGRREDIDLWPGHRRAHK